jgi:hypothetical protein
VLRRQRLGYIALAALVCIVALAAYHYRRAFIRAFFLDGAGQARAPALAASADAGGLSPVLRVRVVVIDGLGRDHAMSLAHHDQACARGYDLIVDTGFPTVSLPVQHALWTGLTQQQSGILFQGKPQILGRARPAPAHGLPARVPGSTALAESHAYIVHALGFARVFPETPTELPDGWAGGGFVAAARDAVASDAALVFVHLLGVDVAGHRQGGKSSPAYGEAARAADEVLGQLMAAEQAAHGQGTRWFVLSDHGHRGVALLGPGGGHGGSEPEIRQVRGCIAGELEHEPAIAPGTYIHLVDYSRAMADSLGLALDKRSAGRPLHAAARAPVDRGATLPAPRPGRWLAAALILLAALLLTGVAARGQWSWLPWWWPASLLCVFVIAGAPSLSVPVIYRPLGRELYLAALPALCVLAVQAALALRAPSSSKAPVMAGLRMVIAQLALPFAAALAAAVLSGGSDALRIAAKGASEPPLMPRFTAYTSALTVLFYAGAAVCAFALVIRAALTPRWPPRWPG